METNNNCDPKQHTSKLKEQFREMSEHLRNDVPKIDDPQAKALFEVSAEVIDGLYKAFNDYEQKNEKAWVQ